jgi:hypothetical protein
MNLNTASIALATLAGGTFVGIDTDTVPILKGGRKNPQQGRIVKRMVGATVMCFANNGSNAYENMVKRRLENEGKNADSFTLSPRTWGQRIVGTPFVEHNGKYYLETIFLRAGKVEYLFDGSPIDPAKIEGLQDKAEAEQGGLSDENKVIIRTFALDSVTALRVNGAEYR